MLRLPKPSFFLFLAAALLLAPNVRAQNASPNADILKMIEAGLPESVVVNKINENAGHWDTSVDALIALKKAGATSAEMTAMTTPPAAPVQQVAAAPEAPTIVAGGVLQRTKQGDIYLKFPEPRTTVFPNGEPSNLAWLISFEGKPAVRVPGERVDGNMTSGNLVITSDRVIFDPYLVENGWGYYPKHGKYVLSPKAWQEMTRDATLNMARSDVKLDYINMEHGKNSVQGSYPSTRATIFSKGTKAYNIGFHFIGVPGYFPQEPENLCAKSEDCLSPQLEAFVRNLIRNFDATIAPFLSAAGITDVDQQLTAVSHYHLTTEADLPKWAAIYQAQIDQLPPPTKTSGGFLSGLGEGLQIAAAGASALQQGNDGGNTPAAQAAAMAQYQQNVAAIESGGTPTLYTPAATAPAAAAPAPAPAAPAKSSPFHFGSKKSAPAPAPSANSGTAAPPVAAPKPAAPTTGTVVGAVCPASGFVPGLMIQHGDTAQGVQCTPGQPIASTGSTPTSTLTNGPPISGDFVAGMDWCVKESFTPLSNANPEPYLTFYNGCAAPAYVMWIVGASGTPAGHLFAAGETFNATGRTQNDVHNAGGVTYYACPADHSVAVDTKGGQIFSAVTKFMCAKRS